MKTETPLSQRPTPFEMFVILLLLALLSLPYWLKAFHKKEQQQKPSPTSVVEQPNQSTKPATITSATTHTYGGVEYDFSTTNAIKAE